MNTPLHAPGAPTVLVTGAGGPAGINVIRSLADGPYTTIGVDIDPLAAGLHLADTSAIVPRCDAPSFVDALIDVATATGATVLISTVAEEMAVLAESADRLAAAGIHSWLPRADAVEACVDKWAFAKCLQSIDVPAPQTGLASAVGIPGPWIVKPRFGRGSRDVIPVDDDDELAWALRRVPEPIVQTRLQGREFTVDTLVDRTGELVAAVPRWRLEAKAGISTKGRTFSHDALVADVGVLLAGLRLDGPANVQGFDHGDGTFTFIEVNPRFSGGLALSLAAGADLVGQYVAGILGRPMDRSRLAYEPDLTMVRHFTEIFVR